MMKTLIFLALIKLPSPLRRGVFIQGLTYLDLKSPPPPVMGEG
jgi:hypothetical protein